MDYQRVQGKFGGDDFVFNLDYCGNITVFLKSWLPIIVVALWAYRHICTDTCMSELTNYTL